MPGILGAEQLPTCFILLAIVSCSNFNDESSSLLLTFNGSDFARNSSARNILVTPDYNGYYIVASVLGDYRETKSLKITGNGTYTIEFDSVPVGSEIYVEANVYNPNVETGLNANRIEPLHIFTGTSDKQTVYAGKNLINLSMKNLQNYENYDLSLTGNIGEQMGSFHFYGYSNGKYQAIYKTYNVNTILSEGLWNPSYSEEGLTAGTVVSIKECAYRTYASANYNGVEGLSDLIIAERPVWSSFTVKTSDTSGPYLPIGATKVFQKHGISHKLQIISGTFHVFVEYSFPTGVLTKSITFTYTAADTYIDLNPEMIFYPNGKYQIVNYNYTTPISTVDIVISEGIWSGSFDESGIIYFKL